METSLTNKECLEYILKLQDKERQKISSSGSNTWILSSALITLIYFLVNCRLQKYHLATNNVKIMKFHSPME